MVSRRDAAAAVTAGAAAARHCPTPSATPTNGVRFALRKRATRPDEDRDATVNISSYNSDFLSGLFSDVAKARILSEFQIPPASATAATTGEASGESFSSSSATSLATAAAMTARPCKKSRLSFSLNAPAFRARPSVKNLFDLNNSKNHDQQSSLQLQRQDLSGPGSPRCMDEELKQQDSLAFQLSCLSAEEDSQGNADGCKAGEEALSEDSSSVEGTSKAARALVSHEVSPKGAGTKKMVAKDLADHAVRLAFPRLPATVSDSSCAAAAAATTTVAFAAGLNRELMLHASRTEKGNADAGNNGHSRKESHFGWFVDLDEHHGAATADSQEPPAAKMTCAVSSDDLAFKAPTAPALLEGPVAAAQEAEVEWAKAADTVDDVLGYFF